MKRKIGTQLDPDVFNDLKVAAAREGMSLGDLIQTAVVTFLQQQKGGTGRRNGLTRLLANPPLQINDQQFREVLDLDYFEQ